VSFFAPAFSSNGIDEPEVPRGDVGKVANVEGGHVGVEFSVVSVDDRDAVIFVILIDTIHDVRQSHAGLFQRRVVCHNSVGPVPWVGVITG
jgi:hypothetical protein